MNHEIDLSKYQIRTDLAIESVGNNEGLEVKSSVKTKDNMTITEITLTDEIGKQIGKRAGDYITIEFEDVTDYANKLAVEKVFQESLEKMLKKMNIKQEDTGLIIGLGNDRSTPDALGPMTINKIVVTRHLAVLGEMSEGFTNVAAMNPGVMGETGIETASIIKGVVDHINPDFVIVIDALKSQSIRRVNKTIQMTDTGIHPGSGVGNSRKEISREVLGIPVLAIGVPTVVDLVTVVSDTVGFMHQHFSYTKSAMKRPASKLAPAFSVNYLKEKTEVLEEDKVNLLGMIGSLTEEETKQLIFEVLTPIGYNLIVTPKEVDFMMDKLSDIIGNGINEVFHPALHDIKG